MKGTNIHTNTTKIYLTFFSLAIWLCSTSVCHAQKPEDRDSIWNEYYTTTEDTTKVNNLLDIGYSYLRTEPDSAKHFAEKALALAGSIGFVKGTAKAYKDLGLIDWAKGNYDEALNHLSSASTLFESLSYKTEMAKCLNNIGYMHYQMGQYPEAIEYHNAYLEIVRQDGDTGREAGALHNIAMVHQAKGDYKEAMEFYLQSVTLKKAMGDSSRLSNSLEALGDIYFELRNYTIAGSYYQRALKIREEEGDKLGMIVSLYNIGRNFKEQGQYEKGMTIFQQGKNLAEELNNQVLVAYHLEGIGSIYKGMGDFDQSLDAYTKSLEARKNRSERKGRSILLNELADLHIKLENWDAAYEAAQEAYDIASELETKEEIKDAAYHLAKVYAKKGKYQMSFQLMEQVNELKDSLFNAEKNREMALLTAEHEIEQEKIQREKEQKEQEVNTQRNYIGGLVLALLLIFLLAGALFFANRQRKHANRELLNKNQELNEKKENLENLNTELKMINQKLELAGQKLQQFAFAASHDLKESIRSVTSFGQLLQKQIKAADNVDPSWLTYLGYISSSGKRMEKILIDLLNYLNLGAKSSGFVQVDLNEVLKDVLNEMEPEIKSVNARLEVAELPTVVAHPHLIEQLFHNLVDNALKYRKEEEPLRVEVGIKLDKEAQQLVFFVKDNGIGIEKKYLDYIFVPFKRLHDRNLSGSGLGLSICRNIVKLYDGMIKVDSTVGQGSTFYFTLPKAISEIDLKNYPASTLQEIS